LPTCFIAGIVAVILVRGGWRERRGVLAFTVPVLIVAGPWYIYHFDQLLTLSHMASDAGASSTVAGSPYPPRWSMQNLTFYLWSAVNLQLIAPLCVFALVGTTASVTRFVRLRDRSGDYTPELGERVPVGPALMLVSSAAPHGHRGTRLTDARPPAHPIRHCGHREPHYHDFARGSQRRPFSERA
jgi:hypothetical protein